MVNRLPSPKHVINIQNAYLTYPLSLPTEDPDCLTSPRIKINFDNLQSRSLETCHHWWDNADLIDDGLNERMTEENEWQKNEKKN